MGPEGGDGGGQVIASGTPEQVASVEASFTGRYLRHYLHGAPLPAAPASP
jgi:excinuclease ABC subunit A